MNRWIADDPFAHLGPARLELWLHQRNDVGARTQDQSDRRENLSQRNKGHVDAHEVDRAREIGRSEVARIEALDDDDACVVSQLPVQLTMANVERYHSGSAALKQYIGEAAGRGADVEALPSRQIDAERLERVRQLETASARVRMIGREERDCRLIVDCGARLRRRAIVDGNLSGQDERARPLARGRQPAFDDELIQANAGHQETIVD
jgi:hypothetical protein